MTKKGLRIIFLGNPEFARYHLQKIVEADYQIVAVISAPDRPAGRGMKILSTPVTTYARELEIPCLQPKNLKNPEFLESLKSYKADVQVVIAFRMLPVAVWDMPSLGTINLHASLLPQYRGAAPINWAIINGETETGVSTFRLKHEIDTGNLIIQKKCSISPNENVGELHDKLMMLGADAMLDTLDLLVADSISEIPQEHNDSLKSAPKLFTENTQINWGDSGLSIINMVRGLCPYPLAHAIFDGKNLKLYNAEFISQKHNVKTGTFISDGKKYLKVYVKDGVINLLDFKLQGKRQMKVGDFLNGYDISHLSILQEEQ